LELEDEKEQLTDLSSQRANWIKDRLVEDFNISTSRIDIDDKHSEEPNNDLYQDEDDEDTRLARDRRVTFIIK
jgi:outer membrane protein OmpA-like peptidoglycan-associated protein